MNLHTKVDMSHLRCRLVALARYTMRGRPMLWAHATRVASRVETYGAAHVALFHDVLEDTDTDRILLAYVLGFEMSRSITLVTRRKSDTYAAYIQRVADSLDPDAVAVKLADLYDHLELAETLSDSLRQRYEKALAVLEPVGKTLGLKVRKQLSA